jgi:hypothetical protein
VHRTALLAALALAVATTMAAGQDGRSIEIEAFAAGIRVLPEGVTEVAETLQINFRGSWQGLIRDIRLDHQTAEGRRVRLDIEVDRVTDGAGQPLRYETQRRGKVQEVRFWVPDARDAVRTAVIHYRLNNVLRFFGSIDADGAPGAAAPGASGPPAAQGGDSPEARPPWDELYWNVTGNDWEMPIRNARARFTLPEGAQGVGAWGYTGVRGSDARDVTVDVVGNVVTVRATRSLSPGEGLTASVVWAPGLVDRVTWAPGPVDRVRDWWPLGLPLLAFALAFTQWWRKGREPRRRSITVQYEPPEGMSPAELGTLVDHKAEMHDITATLVDLAVRGYLLIEEKEEKRFFGLWRPKEFYFHLRKPAGEWEGLESHEALYLRALFTTASKPSVGGFQYIREASRAAKAAKAEGRKFDQEAFMKQMAGVAVAELEEGQLPVVKLSDLNQRFYTHLTGIRNAIYDRLIGRGYYLRRPDRATATSAGFGMVVLGAGFFAFIASLADVPIAAPAAVAVGFGLAGLILLISAPAMRARTPAGVLALEAALGFKEFLKRVESDRYKRMITSPELFERYLPHAMAFRVERSWAAAFEGLYTAPPSWYVGSGTAHFRASSFARELGTMTTRASSAMSSSPSSSGSGGGGSSGGGSGGGGGRGF